MARKTQVILIDDIDGGEANGTVRFGLAGQLYEIDLSTKNANELYAALEKFRENGTRLGRIQLDGRAAPREPARRAPVRANRERNQAIRNWADQQGLKVSPRGRIPDSVVAQFEQAHAS